MSESEKTELKDVVSLVRNRRTDAMFIAAYMAVGLLVYMVVYQTSPGEFAQGVITLVLGVFLNELKNMYSYETGTTRGEMAKSETIKLIAESQINATEQRQIKVEAVVQDIAKTVPVAAALAAVATNGAIAHSGAVTPAPTNPETGVVPAVEVAKVVEPIPDESKP